MITFEEYQFYEIGISYEDNTYGSWCIGRQTGQELRVLGTASPGYVPRAWYYDDRGQVVKEVVGHHDGLGYDLNGNIQGLRRNGRTGASSWGVIDNLTMNRTGNLLTSVTDTGAAAYGGDFHASAGTSSYDSNGALVSDTGRGISSITWNEINLPGIVNFSDGSSVAYCYAADGTKLRETRTVSGTATVIDWCGDLVLEKTGSGARSAKRLMMDGGYVDLASGNAARRHFVRDHLGSVRAVVDDAGTVLETDDYYPLGGPLPTGTSAALQPQKYQGKDWNATASFNVYDFGARLYDPALGRWLSQDPISENTINISPYAFCLDNPLVYVDLFGLSSYSVNGEIYTIDDGDDNFSMSVTMEELEKLKKKFNKGLLVYARYREKLSMKNEYSYSGVKRSSQNSNELDAAVLTVQKTPGTSYIQNQELSSSLEDALTILSTLSCKRVSNRVNIGDNGNGYIMNLNGRIFNGNQHVSVKNLYKSYKNIGRAASEVGYLYPLMKSSNMDPVSAPLYIISAELGTVAGDLLSDTGSKIGVYIGGLLGSPVGAVIVGFAGYCAVGRFVPPAVENIVSGRWL